MVCDVLFLSWTHVSGHWSCVIHFRLPYYCIFVCFYDSWRNQCMYVCMFYLAATPAAVYLHAKKLPVWLNSSLTCCCLLQRGRDWSCGEHCAGFLLYSGGCAAVHVGTVLRWVLPDSRSLHWHAVIIIVIGASHQLFIISIIIIKRILLECH